MSPPILLIVSIDTEEDNWQPQRDGVTVENIRELPRLDALFRRLGVRATYFTTYQVAKREWAATILRELQAEGAEIGAHLHPWNTPPLDEPFLPRNSMLKNLPLALQMAKVQRLTETLEDAIGGRPLAFRAGRYGLGTDTITALLRCGYEIDSSVTPFVSWEACDDGPTFVGAPLESYRLGEHRDLRVPEPSGQLLEVPLSTGFSRSPFGFWSRAHRWLQARAVRPLHLAGIASRTGLLRRILMSPESHSVGDMLTLSRHLISAGVRHLHLSFHSPSLRPGLSPFVADAAGVERLYRAVATYVERLVHLTSVTPVTISEAAAQLCAGGTSN